MGVASLLKGDAAMTNATGTMGKKQNGSSAGGDPKEKGKKPPFDEKTQDGPGTSADMNVTPDYGEATYKGFGRLAGKVALVTGGDSGIGRAVALAFAREGADVAISYLSEHDDAEETKRLVEAAGKKALLIPGDLVEEAHCRRVIDETVKTFGRIDLLVNNAAYQDKAVEKFEDLDPARIERGDERRDRHVHQGARAGAHQAWDPRELDRAGTGVDAPHRSVVRRGEDRGVRQGFADGAPCAAGGARPVVRLLGIGRVAVRQRRGSRRHGRSPARLRAFPHTTAWRSAAALHPTTARRST